MSWQSAICFVIGVCMSASAGWVGMKIATYANVRVSNKARVTKNIGETLLEKLFYYPLVFAACGLIACIIGIATVLFKKGSPAYDHDQIKSLVENMRRQARKLTNTGPCGRCFFLKISRRGIVHLPVYVMPHFSFLSLDFRHKITLMGHTASFFSK